MVQQPGTVNVRVAKQTRQQLAALAKENGLSMQAILERAVEAYRRQTFLEALNSDFADLKARPEEWNTEMEERTTWDQALQDGMKPE